MTRSLTLAALSLSAAALATPLAAQTPAPPDWPDQGSPSVYLAANQPTPPPSVAAPAVVPSAAETTPEKTPPSPVTALAPTGNAARRLAPPSKRGLETKPSDQSPHTGSGMRQLVNFGIPIQSAYTVGTALAVVIGAFLLFAWALRRGGKNSAGRRGVVPTDVVSVLGRVPLAARQFADLLRVGNKLVLVAQTPNGPKTITEVTEPGEVDRLVGLCQQYDPRSTTKEFEHVFQQFAHEPASSGFLGAEALPTSISPAAAAYRSHRGDRARG